MCLAAGDPSSRLFAFAQTQVAGLCNLCVAPPVSAKVSQLHFMNDTKICLLRQRLAMFYTGFSSLQSQPSMIAYITEDNNHVQKGFFHAVMNKHPAAKIIEMAATPHKLLAHAEAHLL